MILGRAEIDLAGGSNRAFGRSRAEREWSGDWRTGGRTRGRTGEQKMLLQLLQ
jgi:hypothetical protein